MHLSVNVETKVISVNVFVSIFQVYATSSDVVIGIDILSVFFVSATVNVTETYSVVPEISAS